MRITVTLAAVFTCKLHMQAIISSLSVVYNCEEKHVLFYSVCIVGLI